MEVENGVTPAITGGATYRQALNPYFNELACNLELAKNLN